MRGQPVQRHETSLPSNSVGLGLRSLHIDQILQQRPDVPWFEILMDNHAAQGGLIAEQLTAVRKHYPVSLHCVGMSIAGTDTLDMSYLARLKWMINAYQPVQVSDHLCFTKYGKHVFNDLLPIPFSVESFHHVSSRINKIQDYLQTKILVENISAYLAFEASDMSEAEFLTGLVKTTGCGLLLDINNAYVNEFNHGDSAKTFIDNLPIESIGEIHLAGYEDKKDYLIDAHNNRVSEPVWSLFTHYLQHATGAPVLLEWDNNIPEFEVLLDEAEKAKQIINKQADGNYLEPGLSPAQIRQSTC